MLFESLKEEGEMGTNYYVVSSTPTIQHPIHIGKSSIGWKFLFNRVSKWDNWVNDEPINTFQQWKEFLETYTKKNRIVVMNEYDEEVPLEDLLKLIKIKQNEDNPDNFSHADNIDGYRFTSDEFC